MLVAPFPITVSSISYRARKTMSLLVLLVAQVMVTMPDTGALLRFVQQTNHADMAEGEKVRRDGRNCEWQVCDEPPG